MVLGFMLKYIIAVERVKFIASKLFHLYRYGNCNLMRTALEISVLLIRPRLIILEQNRALTMT